MGKKFSRRSLQDDAFDAEESVSRRTRVMGQDFADAHDDEMRPGRRAAADAARRVSTDPTEDPVRMYLMQMGQIPLLTREQEVSAAKQIERTRDRYRHSMLATDFLLQGALKLLEQVRDKQLRLDRTIEVSVTNAAEKKAIMKRIVPNVRTLQHLLHLNRADYLTAINKKLPMRQRRAAWKNLVIRRNKAVRLVEEMNLRTGKLQPLFEKLRRASQSDDRNPRPAVPIPTVLDMPGMPTAEELKSELRYLMRLTFETPLTLERRVKQCDSACAKTMRLPNAFSPPAIFAWSFRSPKSIAIADCLSWT